MPRVRDLIFVNRDLDRLLGVWGFDVPELDGGGGFEARDAGDDKPNIRGVNVITNSPSPESPKLLINADLVEGYPQAEPL
jgi:hypothetical protein